jgi:glycosyltransferase involved in cell wall biosynthesis
LIAIFGDAHEYKDTSSLAGRIITFLQEILFVLLKKRLYRKAAHLCKKIVLNIPETETIYLSYLKNDEKDEFIAKRIRLSLGYDPDEFFFDKSGREHIRGKLNISDDEIVLVTVTRVNKRKKLESIIDIVSTMHAEGKKIRYFIVGFLGDEYEQELKDYISNQPRPEIFECFPFLNHQEIGKLYCAADLGIWLKAAISIQESMGTGLPVILEDKPSVSHLINESENGWYFKKHHLSETLETAFKELSAKNVKERIEKRNKTALINSSKLSYNIIAERILEG